MKQTTGRTLTVTGGTMERFYGDLPEKTLLRPDEVAAFLRVSVKTVYRWVAKGALDSVRLKKSLRIYRKSVLDFINRDTEEVHSHERLG